MSDDFQGSHYIQLQPGDSNVPYAFRFIAIVRLRVQNQLLLQA
jgi:hypothetical protein